MSEEELIEPTGKTDGMEEIARANGWKPEEEWKGDPPSDGFKSATDFVRDGFDIQKKQHDKIDRLQDKVSSVQKNLEGLAKGEAKRTRVALEAQMTRLEEERQDAFDTSNSNKFNEVDKQIRETQGELEQVEDPVSEEFLKGEDEFRKKNEWFGDDKLMTAHIMTTAGNLRGAFPEIAADDYYKTLEEDIRRNFPEKFTNSNRDQPSAVSGNTPRSNNGGRENFDSLPPEAKEAYEELSFYVKTLSKDDYAKSYFETESQ